MNNVKIMIKRITVVTETNKDTRVLKMSVELFDVHVFSSSRNA